MILFISPFLVIYSGLTLTLSVARLDRTELWTLLDLSMPLPFMAIELL